MPEYGNVRDLDLDAARVRQEAIAAEQEMASLLLARREANRRMRSTREARTPSARKRRPRSAPASRVFYAYLDGPDGPPTLVVWPWRGVAERGAVASNRTLRTGRVTVTGTRVGTVGTDGHLQALVDRDRRAAERAERRQRLADRGARHSPEVISAVVARALRHEDQVATS